MITVMIGDQERRYSTTDSPDESWINQTLERRRADGTAPCIRVNVEVPGINVTLSNGGCGGGGGGRPPNQREKAVLDLWAELGLDSDPYPLGKLVAFLNRIRPVLT